MPFAYLLTPEAAICRYAHSEWPSILDSAPATSPAPCFSLESPSWSTTTAEWHYFGTGPEPTSRLLRLFHRAHRRKGRALITGTGAREEKPKHWVTHRRGRGPYPPRFFATLQPHRAPLNLAGRPPNCSSSRRRNPMPADLTVRLAAPREKQSQKRKP